jgi:hypothetical protein
MLRTSHTSHTDAVDDALSSSGDDDIVPGNIGAVCVLAVEFTKELLSVPVSSITEVLHVSM